MVCRDIDPPYQKIFVHDAIIQCQRRLDQFTGGGTVPAQILCAVGMLGCFSSITVCGGLAFVMLAALRVGEILYIVPHCQNNLVRHETFIHQVKG